ncbi:unnamed protein product [Schistocephalus solidus]|uniref:DNA repair endonuclease XPF n=2 Tax=Schistocephalus solidus TaxID=70667 RepID=A0A183TA29_SCHSO|nr:unnamed protein product [Schistocephalus solidus]
MLEPSLTASDSEMPELLEYEKSILLDSHNESCMVVCSEGLDLDNIIYTTIKVHSDPHNLVLISNYAVDEARYISKRLMAENETYVPFIITAEVSVKERKAAYCRGGVVFVSSRILVVDLLRGTMPVSLVTGVIVLRCHRLHEASQESFMVRLLREKNPDIFVMAFTDNPVALMSGYNRVEFMMNQFSMPKLLLWPRFNIEIVKCLTCCPPKVEEIQVWRQSIKAVEFERFPYVFLTPETVSCQSYLLEMIKASLKELVENNPILNNDEFSLEMALTNAFHHLTSLYIDPVWHQLSQTSHRLLADIAGLRRLLFHLLDSDAVSFLDRLESLRQAELSAVRSQDGTYPRLLPSGQRAGTCANWLLMNQAEKLLTVARQRVYSCYKTRTYSVELCPKLAALRSIIEEVQGTCLADVKQGSADTAPLTILVLVNKPKTAELIEHFLCQDETQLTQWLLRGRQPFDHPKEHSPPKKEAVGKAPARLQSEPDSGPPAASVLRNLRRPARGGQGGRRVISCQGTAPTYAQNDLKPPVSGVVSNSEAVGEEPIVVENIHAIPQDGGGGEQDGESKNDAGKRDTREGDQCEITGSDKTAAPIADDIPPGCHRLDYPPASKGKGSQLRIVLRTPPPGSREDDAPAALDAHSLDGPAGRLAIVLSRLRPQKIVFFEPRVAWVREVEVYAAREHRRCPLTPEAPPITVYFMVYKDSVEEQRYLTSLRREKEAFEHLIKLRSSVVIRQMEPVLPKQLLGPLESNSRVVQEPCVLVDVREFRSELPALLHRKGMKVVPLTLSIGDYILAPHICVERKSVSDLISSLNSGRLYQQCTAMARYYLNPVLLVEFSMPAHAVSSGGDRFASSTGAFALFTGRNAVLAPGSQLDLGPRHLMSKLVLLTIHFPNLRILWSVTPYCTAELFTELKMGRAEPSLDKLPQDGENLGEDNVEAVDMLLKMPGISWRNYRRVISQVNSLSKLAECSLERLTEILDNR